MIDLIFTLLYIGIIAQIVLLVIAIKKNKRKNWIVLFGIQIIAYITTIVTIIYFGYYTSGFKGAAGIYVGFFVALCYAVVFYIAMCIKIIMYEIALKRQGKKYVNPLCLILATTFIVIGVGMLSYVIFDDWKSVLIRNDMGSIYKPCFLIGGLLIFYRIHKFHS